MENSLLFCESAAQMKLLQKCLYVAVDKPVFQICSVDLSWVMTAFLNFINGYQTDHIQSNSAYPDPEYPITSIQRNLAANGLFSFSTVFVLAEISGSVSKREFRTPNDIHLQSCFQFWNIVDEKYRNYCHFMCHSMHTIGVDVHNLLSIYHMFSAKYINSLRPSDAYMRR